MNIENAIGSNIISINDQGAQMRFPAVSQVEAYWTALRRGDSVPSRSEIDPRGMEDVLEYTFILERIAPGVGRFRLAGMHLCDLMGMEVRGMPATAIFMPDARREIGKIFERVCSGPEVAELTLISSGNLARAPLTAELFMAPLKDDFGATTRILGCLQSIGNIGRQPRRFEVTATKMTEIGVQVVEQVHPAASHANAGFAEPQNGFSHGDESKRPDDTRPALRLVSDNS